MTSIIIFLITIYLIKSIFLGLKSYSLSKKDTSEEYFLAGRNLSWILLGFTIFASWMSTFAYLGAPGFYFKKGVSWLVIHGIITMASPLILWFIGRKMWANSKKYGHITPGDLLAQVHNSQIVRVASGIIGMVALVPYSLIQLIGIGKVIEASTGGQIPFWVGVIISVIGITIYAYIGGMKAIVWTDIIQGLLFGAVMVGLLIIVVTQTGGLWNGIQQAVATKPEAFIFDQSTIGNPLTLLLMWAFGFVIIPHMWQRTYMAPTKQDFSKSVLLSAGLAGTLITIPALFVGILSIGLIPGLTDTDNLLPTLFSNYFEYGLPFLVLGTFGAGMSTIDSQLLSASSICVRDIWEPITKTKLTPKQEKRFGRLIIIVLMIVMTYLALSPFAGGSIILIASKGVSIALLMLVPLVMGLTLNKPSKTASEASLIIGALALLVLELQLLPITLPLAFGPAAGAVLCQIICYTGLLLLEKKKT